MYCMCVFALVNNFTLRPLLLRWGGERLEAVLNGNARAGGRHHGRPLSPALTRLGLPRKSWDRLAQLPLGEGGKPRNRNGPRLLLRCLGLPLSPHKESPALSAAGAEPGKCGSPTPSLLPPTPKKEADTLGTGSKPSPAGRSC